MVDYAFRPTLDPIVAGMDATIELWLKRVDTDADRDWTGATGLTAVFTPSLEPASAFTKTPVLDGDPTSGPQASVAIEDSDTTGLKTPQRLSCVVSATLAGNVEKVRFEIPLVKDA
jgi:hypothetical protein